MTTADSWETCPYCEHFIDWHVGTGSASGGIYSCHKCGCRINQRIELVSSGRLADR